MEKLKEFKRSYFGIGEWEAFYGIFGDVFSKIVAIVGILYFTEGFPAEIVMGKILPGIGLGSIIGCIIYFMEAYRLGKKEGRLDVTALPFGVSSTQVFAWLLLILVPIFRETGDAELAWKVGLAACFIGGIIEILGGFVSGFFIRYIPNSALMGNMAAAALVWLSFNSFVTVFQTPAISVLPLFLIILSHKLKRPIIKGVSNTMLILLVGAAMAWITGYCNIPDLRESTELFGFYPPSIALTDLFEGMSEIGPYLSVIVPLQVSNFIATMQAVQSAAMVGDKYPLKKSMVVDGVSTIVCSVFGSPFPTSVYYGHPGWKKVEARSGYTLMMAVTYLTCFFGVPLIILEILPYEVIIIILMFVGLTAATEVVDNLEKEFSSVIFISFFPVVAQYMSNLINDLLAVLDTSVAEVGIDTFTESGVMVQAIMTLSYGAFASSLLYAVWMAYVLRRRFIRAGGVSIFLAALSAIGFIHNEELAWFPTIGTQLAIVYLIIGVFCIWMELREQPRKYN